MAFPSFKKVKAKNYDVIESDKKDSVDKISSENDSFDG